MITKRGNIKMNAKQLIERLKKISYVATLRKLNNKEIDIIKMSAHRLENYRSAISIRE